MKPIFKIMQLKLSSGIQFTLTNVDYFQATVFNFEQVVGNLFVGAIQNRCKVLHGRSYQSWIPFRSNTEIKKRRCLLKQLITGYKFCLIFFTCAFIFNGWSRTTPRYFIFLDCLITWSWIKVPYHFCDLQLSWHPFL